MRFGNIPIPHMIRLSRMQQLGDRTKTRPPELEIGHCVRAFIGACPRSRSLAKWNA